MGGPQMGCGCGMGAMGCGPPMGGPMGMCGGCNMQGSMGGCAPNMGMGMMPQQPMNSMNQAAYSPPAAAPPPYQNGSMPMQAMGSMSTPSGGGSAFSFIGGSSFLADGDLKVWLWELLTGYIQIYVVIVLHVTLSQSEGAFLTH